MTMLEIVGLTKIYGSKKAIDNISFDLHEGELCGFFGGNGAGKSTLIKIVTGIIGFDSGNVLLDGISVKDEPVEFKKIYLMCKIFLLIKVLGLIS
jgi:hypothetical protein